MTGTMQMTDTNRIEKEIQLRAPKARVWRALTDAAEFGTWFGVIVDGPFVVGDTVHAQVTNKDYDYVVFEMTVETLDPQDVFAYRWHPHPIDAAFDYSQEPTTLVEFRLHETADGTRLTLLESGFDQLSPERRAMAFSGNEKGWAGQMERIRHHVDG